MTLPAYFFPVHVKLVSHPNETFRRRYLPIIYCFLPNLIFFLGCKMKWNINNFLGYFIPKHFLFYKPIVKAIRGGGIYLLRSHKMTEIWTLLLPCSHLFDFGTPSPFTNVQNFTSTPHPPPRLPNS